MITWWHLFMTDPVVFVVSIVCVPTVAFLMWLMNN